MSQVIAARFDSFKAAESAGEALRERGIGDADLSIFFVNPAGPDRFSLAEERDPSVQAKAFTRWAALRRGAAAGFVGVLVAIFSASIGTPRPIVFTFSVLGAYLSYLFATGEERNRAAHRTAALANPFAAGVVLTVSVERRARSELSALLRSVGAKNVQCSGSSWLRPRLYRDRGADQIEPKRGFLV